MSSDTDGAPTPEERAARPDETAAERADRNMSELLQELRVTQTGVQILLAFLLTMPLQARFEKTDQVERRVYVASLLLSALATSCLIAPVAHHRMLFRRGAKEWIVRSADRLAIAGLILLSLAVCSAVELVLDLVIGRPAAITIAVILQVFVILLWWGVPLRHRPSTRAR